MKNKCTSIILSTKEDTFIDDLRSFYYWFNDEPSELVGALIKSQRHAVILFTKLKYSTLRKDFTSAYTNAIELLGELSFIKICLYETKAIYNNITYCPMRGKKAINRCIKTAQAMIEMISDVGGNTYEYYDKG